MKTTFWIAALFTIAFNLQSTALAVDASNSAEVSEHEEEVDDATYEDSTRIDENAPADPPGEEAYDPNMHGEGISTEANEDGIADNDDHELADNSDHEPGSPEYLKVCMLSKSSFPVQHYVDSALSLISLHNQYMEELSRVANEETKAQEEEAKKSEAKVPKDGEESAEKGSELSPKVLFDQCLL